MKKANNILLLSGICLYMVNVCLECYTFLPKNAGEISTYIIISVLIPFLVGLLMVTLPIILLCVNLKRKYSKVFTIIVTIFSALPTIYLLIDPYLVAVPEYLIYSKLGILDTYLVYLLPGGGLLRSISIISLSMITIGAILSIKKEQKKRLDE